MVKNNIADIRDCYGCGVCAVVCPKKIIKIDLNKEGFYVPNLFDETLCNQCGLCLSVCAFAGEGVSAPQKSIAKGYAAWSNDVQVRRECTSGGIGFEIGKVLINQGYKACGVKYNPDLNRAEHFIASTIEGFIPSIKSKYIQSYTPTGFNHFNKNDRFFVTGTPCQIDSIRRYAQKMKIEDHFVLMDFYCHGVPSMNMWRKYSRMVEKKVGRIVHASWRNKRTRWNKFSLNNDVKSKGDVIVWQDSKSVLLSGEKAGDYVSRHSKGNMFFHFFLGDVCLNKPCHTNCKYKQLASSADIRVADFWGKKYVKDTEGISGVVALSEKGDEIMSSLENCTLVNEEVDTVGQGQHIVAPKKSRARRFFMIAFDSQLSINTIYALFQMYLFPRRLKNKVLKVLGFR
ncbi:MAG: Coenzyme F420 hydrogenase/dehydrogenase, beta subunit C-terminal domain [Salinivirgaceae bacterium]|nr:Coenzyme F420 hydrogenase/dehydrogenase, beta subunit C-terminal domain [Salinivirgaceae bacterium]